MIIGSIHPIKMSIGGRLYAVRVQGPNLPNMNFPGVQFAGAQFAEAQFAGGQYARAQFAGAQFAGAQFAGAQFFRDQMSHHYQGRIYFNFVSTDWPRGGYVLIHP